MALDTKRINEQETANLIIVDRFKSGVIFEKNKIAFRINENSHLTFSCTVEMAKEMSNSILEQLETLKNFQESSDDSRRPH